MTLIATPHHVIIQKHQILFIFKIIKFFLLLSVLSVMWWIAFMYKTDILETHASIMYFVIVPFLFTGLNYIFIKLILETIIYFHDLVIFYKDKIVILKNSFFYQSDMEIIDMYRIMKLHITCHGFFQTLIWYGNIRIEQANDDIKIIHFVPRPERIVELLEARRSLIIAEHGKKEVKKDTGNYWER